MEFVIIFTGNFVCEIEHVETFELDILNVKT